MKKIIDNDYSKIVLGILWGLGLACIFRSACNGRNCIIYKAPRPAQIKNKIYSHEDKCYKYDSQSTQCNGDEVKL
jgi:hypothetical protein